MKGIHMLKIRNSLICLFAVYACFGIGTLFGQAVNATITGTISDSSGAVITNANVSATNLATNITQQTRTNESGAYRLFDLPASTFRVEVNAPGFKRFSQSGITLTVGANALLNVTLLPGENTSTITVTEDLTGIQTTSPTTNSVVTGEEIRDLPLNTRNPYSLLALTPGYYGSIGNNYNSVGFSMNGTRTSYGGVPGGFPTVNGNQGTGVFPSVDSIQEFQILAQGYAAEYGRNLGGVLNTAFKAGGNRFHGTAFEFARNSFFDSRDYFSEKNNVALPSFSRHQFGGMFSGPIQRNKSFFMLDTELLRQASYISSTSTVPTALQRTGDFSQTYNSSGALIKIYDPYTTTPNSSGSGYTRTQAPGNVIPANHMSAVAQAIINYYPLPNTTGNTSTGANNYFGHALENTMTNAWDFRVDRTLPRNQSIFTRYSERFYDDNPQPYSGFSSSTVVAQDRIEQVDWMHHFVLGYAIVLKPNMLLDVRLGFSRALYDYLNAGRGFQASSLGLPSYMTTGGGLPIFPVFAPSGYMQLGDRDNRHNAFMTYSLAPSFSWSHGRHNVKIGLDGRLIRVNDHETRDTSGYFAFSAAYTQGPNPATASSSAGNSLASMFFGVGSGDLYQNFKDVASQSYYFGIYAEDEWRPTSKLTISYGLRYDLDTPRTERYNRINFFDPDVASPLASSTGISGLKGGLVFVGVNGRNRYQFEPDVNNLGPRLGISYLVTPETVVHLSGGIVYGPSPQTAAGTVGPYGWRVENDWAASIDGYTPYNTLDNPFPGGFSAAPGASRGLSTGIGGTIEGYLHTDPTPYVEQYSLDIERQLGRNQQIRVGYVGNRGLSQQASREGGIDLDQLPVSYLSYGASLADKVANPFYGIITSGSLSAATTTRAQLLRPFPQFTSMLQLFADNGQTRYDSLQVVYERKLTHGLRLNASYVYSKTYDCAVTHQDSYNPMGSYTVSSIHSPHRIVAGYSYELPFGKGRFTSGNAGAKLNSLIAGWQINGITTIQSGNPLQISASNVSGLGTPTEFANWTGANPAGSGDIRNRLTKYFNTSVFSQPAAYTLGNAPPYLHQLLSPYLFSSDLSLFKEVRVFDLGTLQLRMETFNTFNFVQFGSPNTSVTSSSFGAITSQNNSPRQLQFGAKYNF